MNLSNIVLGAIVLGACYSAWYVHQDKKRNKQP